MEVQAKRVQWLGKTFDSQLEADWATTLEWLGIRWIFHPGSITLPGDVRYEPDFLLLDPWDRAEHDVLAEVKGPHDDRLWKALIAEEANEKRVLILRPGLIPAYSDAAAPGAVWHGGKISGEEWVLACSSNLSEPKKLHARFTTEPHQTERLFVSAERCMTRYDVTGIRMRKAGVA